MLSQKSFLFKDSTIRSMIRPSTISEIPSAYDKYEGSFDDSIYLGDSGLMDTDGDGLNDFTERMEWQTDANSIDSDGDGLSDGDEVYIYRTDPKVSNNQINRYGWKVIYGSENYGMEIMSLDWDSTAGDPSSEITITGNVPIVHLIDHAYTKSVSINGDIVHLTNDYFYPGETYPKATVKSDRIILESVYLYPHTPVQNVNSIVYDKWEFYKDGAYFHDLSVNVPMLDEQISVSVEYFIKVNLEFLTTYHGLLVRTDTPQNAYSFEAQAWDENGDPVNPHWQQRKTEIDVEMDEIPLYREGINWDSGLNYVGLNSKIRMSADWAWSSIPDSGITQRPNLPSPRAFFFKWSDCD